MFCERISQWSGNVRFRPPASADAAEECESKLGHSLPGELRLLFAETNGVEGEYELGLVWSVERVAHENLRFRSREFDGHLMPLNAVFFADAGNGDMFGLSLSGPQGVFVWDHEDDSRRWVAPTIMSYLERWMNGTLKI